MKGEDKSDPVGAVHGWFGSLTIKERKRFGLTRIPVLWHYGIKELIPKTAFCEQICCVKIIR